MDRIAARIFVHLILFYVANCAFNVIERPVNTLAKVGKTIVLRCAVLKEDGQPLKLWWTKDGNVLSFDRDIPGNPRYKCIGDAAKGECHLQIKPVSLEDDDVFECQGQGHFRAPANLSVLVTPTNITLEGGLKNGGVIELREGFSKEVTCAVLGGKPVVEIRWYKDGIKSEEGVKYSNYTHPDKIVDSRARLNVVADRKDHRSVFTCEALHAAFPGGSSLATNFTLNVLYPPGVPVISGYANEEVIIAGERLKLLCQVAGGNPPPKVFWYKNGKLIDQSFHSNKLDITENEYGFTVNHEDDQAEYKCETNSLATAGPLSAVVKLKVHYPPASVDIEGKLEAKAGAEVPLKCVAGPAKPPAKIQWIINGKPEAGDTVSYKLVPNSSGKITVSNVSVQLEADVKRDVSVICSAWSDPSNSENRKSKTATISVFYPPESVTVYGYDGKHLKTGDSQLLTCVVEGGKPLPTVHWFKGKKKVEKGVSTPRISSSSVQSELRFRADPSDNRAHYRCEARSRALEKPLTDAVNLTVYFLPKEVNITVSPARLTAGKIAKLVCETGSANPAPLITWWRNDVRQEGAATVHQQKAEHFGFTVKNRLFVPLDADTDGARFTCGAENSEIEGRVSQSVQLLVHYKPIFAMESPQVISVLENETISVNASARGKPGEIQYEWRRGKSAELVPKTVTSWESGLIADGPILKSATVKRIDAGIYIVTARNEVGASNFTVNINVSYAAEVSRVTSPVVVDIGEEATLECHVDANPHIPNMIKWERKDFDMSTVVQSFGKNNSTLKLKSAKANSSGIFVCVADNKRGQPARKEVQLLVRQAPTLDKSASYRKAAGKIGGSGVLRCRAVGAPSVTLSWYKDGVLLPKTQRVVTSHRKIGLMIYESTVEINPVENGDYGMYLCVANNTLGNDHLEVEFEKVGPPHLPENLKLINVSGTSVTLGWKPGFDGGMPQSFQIVYRVLGQAKRKTVHVEPPVATRYTVSGLRPYTRYAFSVGARNRVGFSGYTEEQGMDALIVETSGDTGGEISPLGVEDEAPMLIVLIFVVGLLLLLLNICVLICCIRRHKKRKMQAAAARERIKRVTIQSPTSSEKTTSARLMDVPRPVQMYGPDGASGLRPDSQYTAESDHRGHSEFSEDDASIRTVIEVDSTGQPVYKSVSPGTFQTYLVDDPHTALIMSSEYADIPSDSKYAESLRANSLQRRLIPGYMSPTVYTDSTMKVPLYAGEGIEDPLLAPMGPLRNLSEELNQYAPYSHYTPARNGLLRTYNSPNNTLPSPSVPTCAGSMPSGAIPTAVVQSSSATPYAEVRPMVTTVNGANGNGNGTNGAHKHSSGSLGRANGSSPVLTTFAGGYPTHRQNQEYFSMDQGITP